MLKNVLLLAGLVASTYTLTSKAEDYFPVTGGEGPHPLCVRESIFPSCSSPQLVQYTETKRGIFGRTVTTTYYAYSVLPQTADSAIFVGESLWFLTFPDQGYTRRRLCR